MNHEQLLTQHDIMCHKGREIMHNKNRDYTPKPDEDALDQFKLIAKIVGITPEQVALVYKAGKLIRMGSLLQHAERHVKDESIEDTNLDDLNYSVLLGALLSEWKQGGRPIPSDPPLKEVNDKMAAMRTQQGQIAVQTWSEQVEASKYKRDPDFFMSAEKAKTCDLSGPLVQQAREEAQK